MSAEANKVSMRRLLKGLDQGNFDVIDQVFAADCVWHLPTAISPKPIGREEYKQFVGTMTTTFTEMVHDIDDFVAADDKLFCRMTISAKHTGDFQGTAPTGKSVSFGSHVACDVRNGQVVEMWVQADFLGLMQQIGAVPEATAAS